MGMGTVDLRCICISMLEMVYYASANCARARRTFHHPIGQYNIRAYAIGQLQRYPLRSDPVWYKPEEHDHRTHTMQAGTR